MERKEKSKEALLKENTILQKRILELKSGFKTLKANQADLQEKIQAGKNQMAIDITDRKRAEKELLESEKQYKMLVNALPAIVYKGYPDWSVEFFDDKIVKLTGLSAEDFNSRKVKWSDIMVKEDIESAKQKYIHALKTDHSYVRLFRIKTGDDNIVWIEDRGQIVCDDSGRVQYSGGIFFDITEKKQIEESNRKLEEQFQQSQKMEAIGTLTGGISHDFNNLLTTIIGNAELYLMDIDKSSPLHDGLKEIQKAGKSAADLIRQLLAFSRRQPMQPKSVDLNHEIKNMEKMIRRIIGEDIIFSTVPEPGLWKIDADPGQINQVIMNLMVNAKDAMPMGGSITIKTANANLDGYYFKDHGLEAEPGSYVMLSVADTGTGMDEAVRMRIFDPFFTTKKKGRGTGLGLSTVYGIVKQNKGYIWVYSQPKQGTIFKIFLPKGIGNTGYKREKREPGEVLDGSETILMVEDDKRLRKMTKKILRHYGYKVLAVRDGEKALKVGKTHKGHVHLLLTDVVMPGMSGKKVAERLEIIRPDIRVIYMSGYFDETLDRHGVVMDDIKFIEKPFGPKSMARKVLEVLEKAER